MSKEALTKVVQRAISDAAFRNKLTSDASGALRGYDLTADEINAMRSRDAAKLTAFGVDVRMSKVFTLDPGTGGSATLTSGSEPRDVAPVWVGDGSASTEGAVTSSEPRDVAPVWIGDGSETPLHTYSGDDNAGPEGALSTGTEPRDVAPTWIGDGSETDGALTTGTEPRDVAPTWIGETSATGDGLATDEGQLTNDSPGEIHIDAGDGNLDQ